MAERTYAKENKGYRVKQFGGICQVCHKKMGKGTTGIGVRTGHSFWYYHPSCYKRRPQRMK